MVHWVKKSDLSVSGISVSYTVVNCTEHVKEHINVFYFTHIKKSRFRRSGQVPEIIKTHGLMDLFFLLRKAIRARKSRDCN